MLDHLFLGYFFSFLVLLQFVFLKQAVCLTSDPSFKDKSAWLLTLLMKKEILCVFLCLSELLAFVCLFPSSVS